MLDVSCGRVTHRVRSMPNIKPTLGKCIVFDGYMLGVGG